MAAAAVALPEELIEKILLQLSVKYILRFRCVSKSWSNLIDSPYFIKRHLNNPSTHQTKSIFIKKIPVPKTRCSVNRSIDGAQFTHWRDWVNYYGICYVEFPAEISSVSEYYAKDVSNGVEEEVIKLGKYPLKYDSEILCSSNGLILVNITDDKLMLWNPFTNNTKILPETPDQIENINIDFSRDLYGLKYHIASNDYKIVRIHKSLDFKIWVYSLRSNSWIKFNSTTFVDLERATIVQCLYGLFHTRKLIAFDFETNEFERLQIPLYHQGYVMEDRLYLTGFNNDGDENAYLYVGEKHGAEMNWIKLGPIPQTEIEGDNTWMDPLWYSEDGNRILIEEYNQRVFWYDFKHETVETLQMHGHDAKSFNWIICRETLVNPSAYGSC